MPEASVRDYVAVCPISPGLAADLVGLADLRWREENWWEVCDEAMRALGWCDEAATELSFAAWYVTSTGHHVFEGDHGLMVPFCEKYQVGPDHVFVENEWGKLPGWTSRLGAGHNEYDAHLSTAVRQFTELLGPPDLDVIVEAPDVPSGWRHTGWRRGGNALLLAQGAEPFSYHCHEEAKVCIRLLPPDGQFPSAERLTAFTQS